MIVFIGLMAIFLLICILGVVEVKRADYYYAREFKTPKRPTSHIDSK